MRISTVLFLLFAGFATFGQILEPAKWTYSVSNPTPKVGDEIELIFKVSIDKNWYLYASEFPCEDGPTRTSITFKSDPGFQLLGKLRDIKPIDKHDHVFDCDVKIFKVLAEFRQKIRILKASPVIHGAYEAQVCTDVDGRCVPFGDEFTFDEIHVQGGGTATTTELFKQDSNLSVVPGSQNPVTGNSQPFQGPIMDKTILEGAPTLQEESFLGYLVFAFILGLASLITPCVFPMVPMTVTFFLKDNQTRREGIRKAIIFGISIIVIYTLAGTLFAVLLGAEGLNALATHWAPNLFIFIIFIVFALSFFGLFEINAPNKLVNSADRQAEKGGLMGIFFMAATLVLVSFSCTIPIVGNVVVMSAGGKIIKPVLAMFSYSLAFSIPFTLFAIFPEWIKSLPKSGGWLNSVKVTLGFLELALCWKFLSIADQAYHWGLLDRDVNIALWIVIFGLLGVYFLGKLRMAGDSPIESVTVPRLLLAIPTFAFVVYLIPGLWGAPLKMLAGYLPPTSTLDFDLVAMTRGLKSTEVCDEPIYADYFHLPHGLNGYFEYKQALQCARQQNKPLFIDFTGHGCTNCREMEAVVWSEPQVLERLQNDFVIVALYVDDKTELPESLWYTSAYDHKVKKTIGKQNADLQIRNLENNAQPFYVLVGSDERVLAWPYGYDRSPEKFVQFLERGKKKFNALYK